MADSATTSEPKPSEPVTPSPSSMAAKRMSQLAGLKMAHRAMMLEDARAVLEQDRRGVDAYRKEMGIPVADAEDMGDIRIGDEVHNHYQYPTTAQPAAPQQPGGMSGLAKAGLLAAGVALGGIPAAGLATYLAPHQDNQQELGPDNVGGIGLMPPLTKSEQPVTVAPAAPVQP